MTPGYSTWRKQDILKNPLCGWCEQDRQTPRKNDPAKLEIAARRHKETTLSIKDIAARVPLGTSKTANRKLHGHLRRCPAYDPAQAQLAF